MIEVSQKITTETDVLAKAGVGIPSVDLGDARLSDVGELPGPVLGEFIQTEDEVGAEVLAQEVTVH